MVADIAATVTAPKRSQIPALNPTPAPEPKPVAGGVVEVVAEAEIALGGPDGGVAACHRSEHRPDAVGGAAGLAASQQAPAGQR